MKCNYKFREENYFKTKNKKHNRKIMYKKNKDMIACESANYNLKEVA